MLILSGLCHRVRAVEQENRDLLVGLLADIHGVVNALTRLLPLNLTGRDLNALALSSITVLNREQVATRLCAPGFFLVDMQFSGLVPVVGWEGHSPDVARLVQFDAAVLRLRWIDIDDPSLGSLIRQIDVDRDSHSDA